MNIKTAMNAAKRYKIEIEKKGISVTEMYIFGSVAKKTAHKGSDIDVCVVSSKFGKDMHAEQIKLIDITSNINESIEPHPFTVQEMKETYNPLVSEILRYGIKVL